MAVIFKDKRRRAASNGPALNLSSGAPIAAGDAWGLGLASRHYENYGGQQGQPHPPDWKRVGLHPISPHRRRPAGSLYHRTGICQHAVRQCRPAQATDNTKLKPFASLTRSIRTLSCPAGALSGEKFCRLLVFFERLILGRMLNSSCSIRLLSRRAIPPPPGRLFAGRKLHSSHPLQSLAGRLGRRPPRWRTRPSTRSCDPRCLGRCGRSAEIDSP